MSSAKPVIFISYSHKDEPEKPRQDEIQWLSFVRTYLQPAIKNGIFDLFVDEHLSGGADLKPEIERKLHDCDVFIPLISAKQLAIAAEYIKTCGYHRRDEELAELHAVLEAKRAFADLPPRV
jgi:hypothetical protein